MIWYLVAVFRKPHLCLFLKGNDGLGDLEPGEQSGILHVGQQHRRGPALLPEVASKPGWVHWVESLRKRPFVNLREPSADICGKRTIDGDAGHAVTWVPEPLEIGLGFPFPLEAG